MLNYVIPRTTTKKIQKNKKRRSQTSVNSETRSESQQISDTKFELKIQSSDTDSDKFAKSNVENEHLIPKKQWALAQNQTEVPKPNQESPE